MNYAKRIQNAILPHRSAIEKAFGDAFVLFKPKDIVSGDFFWFSQKPNKLFIAAVDCTGHGVPGAFLTMLGTAYLNEIISLSGQMDPNEILDQLREKVVIQLSQSEDIEDSKDGMDISLICLNLKTLTAQWAGAHNPIYIVGSNDHITGTVESDESNALLEIKGDKQPIGFHSRQSPFHKHEIRFKKGDSFFLLSDGFADQFGGPDNKKYRYKPLKKFILSISDKSSHDQKVAFEEEFERWKGNEEQLDDVCVIGVKL